MRTLCDVNLLVAICYEAHEHHSKALRWLGKKKDSRSLLICRAAHLGLLRLLNNPSVMGPDVRSAKQVWAISDLLFSDDRFEFAGEPLGLITIFRAFTSAGKYTPKVWQDAYLAAFATKAGFSFATFDGGFSKFKELSLDLIR